MQDIDSLYGANVCTEEDEAKCEIEHGKKHLKWTCQNCKKKKRGQISPWTYHLLELRRLQQGGYPFKKNDLSREEWLDLGLINELIESKRKIF